MATQASQQLGWQFGHGPDRRSRGHSTGNSMSMSEQEQEQEPEFDGIIRRSVDVEIRSINEVERSVEFVASTNSIDSHGDVVDQKFDLKRFKKNPVILWHHNKFGGFWSDGVSRPQDFLPIGRGENTKLEKNEAGDKQLTTKVFFGSKEYNELAEQVWLGCKERIIRAVSIGFRPGKVTEKTDEHGGKYYELSDNELYEISVVPIPSNPDSVAKSVAFEHKHLSRLAAKQSPGNPAQENSMNDIEKAAQAKAEADVKIKALETELATSKAAEGELAKRAELAEKSLAAVLKAAGAESPDAAVGTIATALEARDKLLPEAQNRIKELEKANEDGEAAELLNKLKAENRISPAQEKDLWPSLSLESKKEFAKTAPPINGAKVRESEDSGSAKAAVLPTWSGKNYNELSYSEKAALKKADEKLWAEMKASVEAN